MNILKDKIKLIIFDISGTLIDHGSLATVYTFQKVFKNHNLKIHPELIIKDMGINKDKHIKKILSHPYISKQLKNNINNKKEIYNNLKKKFNKILKDEVENKFDYISGFNNLIKYIRDKNILIGITTGYPRSILDYILIRFKEDKNFKPDFAVSASDVKRGRPYNDMVIKILKRLKIKKFNTIKIDDSISGILEGKNSGVKTIGLTLSGIHYLKTRNLRKKVSKRIQDKNHFIIKKKFKKVKTDFIVRDIGEIKNLLIKNFNC